MLRLSGGKTDGTSLCHCWVPTLQVIASVCCHTFNLEALAAERCHQFWIHIAFNAVLSVVISQSFALQCYQNLSQ
jgi:hypothetical protein